MKSILEYLKDRKFTEAIKELRRKKNTVLKSNDVTPKEKIKAINELDNTKISLELLYWIISVLN